MQLNSIMCLVSTGLILTGCASTLPPFDSKPTSFASASELAKREAAKPIPCNTYHAVPVMRIPALLPRPMVRSGRVSFMFDLDDVGMPVNVRIREATEEVFIKPMLRSLEKWKYTAKSPDEPASKRENLCSAQNFKVQDERGREIPTWTDIEEKNEAYQRYKTYQSK